MRGYQPYNAVVLHAQLVERGLAGGSGEFVTEHQCAKLGGEVLEAAARYEDRFVLESGGPARHRGGDCRRARGGSSAWRVPRPALRDADNAGRGRRGEAARGPRVRDGGAGHGIAGAGRRRRPPRAGRPRGVRAGRRRLGRLPSRPGRVSVAGGLGLLGRGGGGRGGVRRPRSPRRGAPGALRRRVAQGTQRPREAREVGRRRRGGTPEAEAASAQAFASLYSRACGVLARRENVSIVWERPAGGPLFDAQRRAFRPKAPRLLKGHGLRQWEAFRQAALVGLCRAVGTEGERSAAGAASGLDRLGGLAVVEAVAGPLPGLDRRPELSGDERRARADLVGGLAARSVVEAAGLRYVPAARDAECASREAAVLRREGHQAGLVPQRPGSGEQDPGVHRQLQCLRDAVRLGCHGPVDHDGAGGEHHRDRAVMDGAGRTPAAGDITGYQIEVSTDGGTTWTDLVANTASTGTTYAHTGLSAGTTRHYRVSAINSVGAGTASTAVSARTPSAPDPPTNLTVQATSSTAIALSWAAPANTGGADIPHHRLPDRGVDERGQLDRPGREHRIDEYDLQPHDRLERRHHAPLPGLGDQPLRHGQPVGSRQRHDEPAPDGRRRGVHVRGKPDEHQPGRGQRGREGVPR